MLRESRNFSAFERATVAPATRRDVFSAPHLALALALQACAAGRAGGAPTIRASTGAGVAAPYAHATAPAAVVHSVELSPPPQSEACRLRMRTAFHLRPGPVPMSVGPEVGADTEVVLTAISHLTRSVHGYEHPFNEVFARVRLVGEGREGYAFVRAADISERCRLSPERAETLAPLAERLAVASRRRFAARGFFRLPNQPLRGGFERGRDEVVERLDADGDGARDAVLLLHTQGRDGAFVLRRQTAQGWAAADLSERVDHDHFSAGYEGTRQIEGATYFRIGGSSMGYFTRAGCGRVALVDDTRWTTLLRLHPSGDLIPVLAGDFRVGDDGSVRVAGVRHRWDAAQFAFVPEDPLPPGVPWFEPDGAQCPSP